MYVKGNTRINSLAEYTFDSMDKRVRSLRSQGISVIDFGVGDPKDGPALHVRSACQEGVDTFAHNGYPSYRGSLELRSQISVWMNQRFGVTLDPDREILITAGSKEAIFNFPNAFIDNDDYVIIPNPGYPPYTRGTLFAGGNAFFVPLRAQTGFQLDIRNIPEHVLEHAQILWINYPNNPTAACVPLDYLKDIVAFAHAHNIIVASDESYSELYYDSPPPSILEVCKEGVIAFHSFSKRSAMTGYRIGWVAGDERIVQLFAKLKVNIDSGVPDFIQHAAVKALADESHPEAQRALYAEKRAIMQTSLSELGLAPGSAQGTFYIWQPVPSGMTSQEFAMKLLDERIGIVTIPGNLLAETIDGINPGEGFVRFALVPSVEQCAEAARRLKAHLVFPKSE